MKDRSRKIFAIMLVIILCFSVVPVTVFATNTDTENQEEQEKTPVKVVTSEESTTDEFSSEETTTEDPEDEELPSEILEEELLFDEEEYEVFEAFGDIMAASSTSVVHTVGQEIYYDFFGYTGHYFSANGNTAFCVNPGIPHIETGVYAISRYISPGTGYDLMIKCAYYLYGGPGYDSVKYGLFSDPNSMEAYGLSHVAISYAYDSNQSGFNRLSSSARTHVMNMIAAINSQSMAPSGFDVYLYNEGNGSTQAFLGWDYVPLGHVEIVKTSSNTSMTDGNDCYSLEGAVFDVYNRSNQKIGSITTNSSGKGRLNDTNADTGFYVVEVTAPKGYALNSSKISFDINAGQTTTVNVSDKPQNDPIGILLRKWDSDTGTRVPQGDGSLEKAEFKVKYYKGLYDNSAQVSTLTPSRTWVLRTDSNGLAFLHPDYLLSGDAFYYSGNNDPTLPLGTITIEETKAPEGYLINNEIFVRQVTSEGVAESVFTYNEPIVKENVKRGGVVVQKWDNEIVENRPQGGATLEGAVFAIINRSMDNVMVEGILYAPGKTVYSMTTDKTGTAKTANNLLPYGTYEVKEESPPLSGYLSTGVLSRSFTITENEVIVKLDTAGTAIRNNPMRGDLRGVKISDSNHNRMKYIPFSITSLTTGESHVIVTDKNGEFSTSTEWNPHSQNTNRGETEYDGTWFGEVSTLKDNLGALLYDNYLIEELPCEANKGKELLSFEVSIYRHNVTVNLGTLTNDDIEIPEEPEIFTTAIDKESESNNAYVSKTTTIVDTVYYSGLAIGKEYTAKGILMDKSTSAPLVINGKQITAEKTFRAPTTVGTVTMEFIFDSSILKGKSVVVFETLYEDEKEIAKHTDIDDEGQTISFIEPTIGTTAKGKDGSKIIPLDKKAVVVDTVHYENLIVGVKYTLHGILMDKSTNKPLLIDGKEVTKKVTFTSQEPSGDVDVVFTFDSTIVAGKTLVVFETLEYESETIAEHRDITDEGQTVIIKENPPTPKPPVPVNPPVTPSISKIPYTGRDNLTFWFIFVGFGCVLIGLLFAYVDWKCNKELQNEKRAKKYHK